jgi:hypothetical protein
MFAIYLPKLNKYVRRMSYSNVALISVHEPEKATLYSRQRDAENLRKNIIRTNDSWRKDPNYATIEIWDIEFSHKLVKKVK